MAFRKYITPMVFLEFFKNPTYPKIWGLSYPFLKKKIWKNSERNPIGLFGEILVCKYNLSFCRLLFIHHRLTSGWLSEFALHLINADDDDDDFYYNTFFRLFFENYIWSNTQIHANANTKIQIRPRRHFGVGHFVSRLWLQRTDADRAYELNRFSEYWTGTRRLHNWQRNTQIRIHTNTYTRNVFVCNIALYVVALGRRKNQKNFEQVSGK